jgi:predicted DNA-binding transcriptional regulator YafY
MSVKIQVGIFMRADRLVSIVLLLQTRGKLTTKTLATELEVSQRTILRDLDALTTAGIPIYADGGHGGGVALDENYRLSLTGLKEAEVRSLFVSSNSRLLSEIGLGEAAEGAQLKLLAALPLAHQSAVELIRQRIHIDPLWWWHDSQQLPFWEALQQAVYEDRCIQTIYENSSGNRTERTLEPYSLVAKSSIWYLIARHDAGFRTYRVSRFQSISLLETTFHRQPDFDLPIYWQEHLQEFTENLSEYRFTLEIAADRVNFLQWIIPGRYQLVAIPEDHEYVVVHLHLESVDLARMLIFGLGASVRMIEPPELREAVLKTAQEVIDSLKPPAPG